MLQYNVGDGRDVGREGAAVSGGGYKARQFYWRHDCTVTVSDKLMVEYNSIQLID